MAVFEMTALDVRARYALMTHLAVPRPIALVSTLSGAGASNLAPFSFFTLGGANPPSCVICPLNNRAGEPKDTLLNIRETGEYVVNVVTRRIVEQVNQASWSYPRGVSEFKEVGLHPAASREVRPPRVADSPVAIECKLFTIVEHGSGPLSGSYIIGEMLVVHAADAVLTDGQVDETKLDAVGRLGGEWYCTTMPAALFALPRPTEPQSQPSSS